MADEGAAQAAGIPAGADRHLRRTLGAWSLFAICLGGIIGSGWLFGVLRAASIAGPASILSWVIGGLFALALTVSWYQLGSAVPRSGGSARYAGYSHGSYTGFLIAWIRVVTVGTIPAIEAEAVITALGAFLTRYRIAFAVTATSTFNGTSITTLNGFGTLFAVVLVVGFFLLNLRGALALSRANDLVSLWKVVVPLGTIVGLFFLANLSNFTVAGPTGTGGFAPYGWPSVLLAVSTSGVLFAYLGFAQAIDFSAEARDPRRDLPRAVLGGVGVAAAIYVLLEVAFVGALRFGAAGVRPGDWHALAGSSFGTLPLYFAVSEGAGLGFAALGIVLLTDAWVSPTGTGWIFFGGSGRSIFGLSVDGYLPPVFRRLTPTGRVPWVALLASLALALVFLLPLPSWYQLVAFISSATVLSYLAAPLALPALARAVPGAFPSRRRTTLAALAGFEVVALGLYWCGFEVLTWLLLVVAAGLGLYLAFFAPEHLGIGRARIAAVLAGFGAAIAGAIVLGPLGPSIGFGPSGSIGPLGWGGGSPLADRSSFLLLAAGFVGVEAALLALATGSGRRTVVAGAWLPPWLLATYLLSYAGAFGPTGGLPGSRLIPFPYDSAIAAGLGLIAFVAALRSALPAAAVRENLELPREAEEVSSS